jgi:hypothetical protein
MRREAIRRTLAHLAGEAPDASAVARATLHTWHRLATRLAPVIGVRGVEILFSRSLHLTATLFPWLARVEEEEEGRMVLPASLKACLAGQETDAAAEASDTLLVTFTEQLTSLIGESLTERLLEPVWTSLSAESEIESEHEIAS